MAPHELHDKITGAVLGTASGFAVISLATIQTVVAIVAGLFSIVGVCYAIRYYRAKTKALQKAFHDSED